MFRKAADRQCMAVLYSLSTKLFECNNVKNLLENVPTCYLQAVIG